MKKIIMLACGSLCFSAVVSTAQEVLLPSTVLMREQGQLTYRDLNNMVKGEAPFDAEKSKAAFTQLAVTAGKIPDAFPESSKGKKTTNGRYSASPKVWDNQAEFRELALKLGDAARQAAASVKGLDDLKAEYTRVNNACNACHEKYRDRVQ